MQRIAFIIIVCFSFAMNTHAQEVLTGLGENVRVKKAARNADLKISGSQRGQMLQLPFLDDFTNPGVFPNDSLWIERDVFINNSYCFKPFNIGVATFDALNDTGSIHSNSLPSIFSSDTLTSREIRLDSITAINKKLSPKDSVYLSFHIQPQGLGNAPEEKDSIVLKFYSPKTKSWFHQWSMGGKDLQTFYDSNLAYTKRIMIPVTDSIFFQKGFKMRFYNYASLSDNNIPSWVGNVDIWNLDYVYMDIQRTYNDTSLVDWTLTSEAHSLLKDYEQMPWNQYKAAPQVEMDDTFNIAYRSNKGHKKDVNMTFTYKDLSGLSSPYTTVPSPITNQKMPSFSTYEFVHQLDDQYPANTLTYNDFELLFHINVPDDPYNFNDTSRFYQRFYNYYAYDDGTAEAGYGLSLAGSQLAYQFRLNDPDTLQSVMMYFNRVKNNANVKNFTLTVWDDDGGKPGNVIYEQTGVFPKFNNRLNSYSTYVLDNPVPVGGTFYVGWQQVTDDNLNLGFDVNRNARSHIFYNTFGNWSNTIYEGALMMRPILGNEKYAHVGVEHQEEPQQPLVIYPNPASPGEQLNIKAKNTQPLTIQLFDLQGKMHGTYQVSGNFRLPELSPGMYILRIQEKESGLLQMKKLIIR